MRTAPSNKKVRELINLVRDEKLMPRPEFQRRLVWTNRDKDRFLDTVLKGYPFPEIYLADGNVDLETGEGTQLLVDGLQRVSTLIEYFEDSSNLRLLNCPPYKDLEPEQKTAFLQYDVAVRDLGNCSIDEIVEVFKRINATKYSLSDIEINNAVYSGELKQFCASIAENDFFSMNNVFNTRDYRRMGDIRYALTIVITMMAGYFNRDTFFEDFLDRHNDDFERAKEIKSRIEFCFDYISECGFPKNSRIWKKADLFSALIELDNLNINNPSSIPDPSDFVNRLNEFYETIEDASWSDDPVAALYYKASIQATNDRINRVRRGAIISDIMVDEDRETTWAHLQDEKLTS